MIRLACPGCQTAFSVGDEKAGKTGKCPKCGAKFTIPRAESSTATPAPLPAPPPTPAVPDPTVEINPCPECRRPLAVPPTQLGGNVQCPDCEAVFRAVARSSALPALRPSSRRSSRRDESDDEDEERPSRRRRSRYRQEDDEESNFDLDLGHRDRPGSNGMAIAAMILGIVGLIAEAPSFAASMFGAVPCCCPLGAVSWPGHVIAGILGLTGLILALVSMNNPIGKGMWLSGLILSAVTLILLVVGVILSVSGFAFFVATAPTTPRPVNPPAGQPFR